MCNERRLLCHWKFVQECPIKETHLPMILSYRCVPSALLQREASVQPDNTQIIKPIHVHTEPRKGGSGMKATCDRSDAPSGDTNVPLRFSICLPRMLRFANQTMISHLHHLGPLTPHTSFHNSARLAHSTWKGSMQWKLPGPKGGAGSGLGSR